MKLGQNLRYKDYQLMKKEVVDKARLSIPKGEVQEVTSMKELGALFSLDQELYKWWRVNMGFEKGE